jgi:hypothetical protein
MIAEHTDRKSERGENDLTISGSVVGRSDRSTLDAGTPELPRDRVQEELAAFGVPKSKRGARDHVVLSRPSRPSSGGAERRIENLAPDEWQPRYPATRRLSDRVPFAHALSGYDPDRVSGADYAWRVP